MKIPIDDKWGISSDERQYYLAERSTRKNKEGKEVEYYRTKWSYGHISGVLKAYKEIILRTKPDITNFKQIAEMVEELDKKIDKISKELGV